MLGEPDIEKMVLRMTERYGVNAAPVTSLYAEKLVRDGCRDAGAFWELVADRIRERRNEKVPTPRIGSDGANP